MISIPLSYVWLHKVPDFEFVSGIDSHIFPIWFSAPSYKKSKKVQDVLLKP